MKIIYFVNNCSKLESKNPFAHWQFQLFRYQLQDKARNLGLTVERDLSYLQRNDPAYEDMFKFLESNVLPEDTGKATLVLKTFSNYFIADELLYHVWIQPGRGYRLSRSHVQLAVPHTLVNEILTEAHDSPLAGGHLGINWTLEKVRTKYFWPKMYGDVVNWVKSCLPCNKRKAAPVKVRAQVIPMPVPRSPFERISTDILGPLPTCQNTGNKYVIVFIDFFTKYVELVAVPDIKARTVVWAFLTEVICRHGTPSYLHSDRGTNYLSHIVKETCKLLQITKTQTSSYHPQCNSQSEHMMSVILAFLAKRLDAQHDTWDRHLPFVQFVHNNSPCLDSTGYSPAFLTYGRHPRSPLDTMLPAIPDPPRSAQQYLADLLSVLECAKADAEAAMTARKQFMMAKGQQMWRTQSTKDFFTPFNHHINYKGVEMKQRTLQYHLTTPTNGYYAYLISRCYNTNAKPHKQSTRNILVKVDRTNH